MAIIQVFETGLNWSLRYDLMSVNNYGFYAFNLPFWLQCQFFSDLGRCVAHAGDCQVRALLRYHKLVIVMAPMPNFVQYFLLSLSYVYE